VLAFRACGQFFLLASTSERKGGIDMRKRGVFGLAVVAAVMLVAGSLYAQPMGPGMMGQGGGWGPGYGPQQQQGWGPGYGMGPGMMGGGWGPGYGMGPGMMGGGWGPGYGMGPGMMGRGWGPGYGMGPGMMGPGYGSGYGPQYQQPQKPLEKSDAEAMVNNYLAATRNPNLKLGKIEDKGNAFEADIVTKDNALADKIFIDKNTGWMRSAY
jgi:hypothetical protein